MLQDIGLASLKVDAYLGSLRIWNLKLGMGRNYDSEPAARQIVRLEVA